MPAHVRARLLRILAVLVPTLFGSTALAQDAPNSADEYRLKAAFLFNFATFTQWPKHDNTSLLLCVYGDAPFGHHLHAIAGRMVGARSLQVHRISSVDTLGGCNMVFITRPMIGNLGRVLDNLNGRPVLTVADSPGAMENGVMLNMDSSAGRISFSANLASARRQGLTLSSKLLNLATEIKQ